MQPASQTTRSLPTRLGAVLVGLLLVVQPLLAWGVAGTARLGPAGDSDGSCCCVDQPRGCCDNSDPGRATLVAPVRCGCQALPADPHAPQPSAPVHAAGTTALVLRTIAACAAAPAPTPHATPRKSRAIARSGPIPRRGGCGLAMLRLNARGMRNLLAVLSVARV